MGETKSHSPKHGGRAIEAPVLSFDLQVELEHVWQQPGYQNGELAGRTLVKQAGLRIMLMALRSGGRMQAHHASGPISIQVIEGRLRVRVSDDRVELVAGHLLALEAGIQHDVEAIEDGVFLLTIGQTKYQHVSDLHERTA
jgi:quercetin dioxygenase-like cupin family protein